MAERKSSADQRRHIVESIDTLMYQKGFNSMSFSDISNASGVSKGNLYYYFKTKDDILQAVIEYRLDNMKEMLAEWEAELTAPLLRLKRYAQIVINESANVVHYGCPMGSLNTELAKSQPLLQKMSKRQLDVFKNWLKKQFKLMLPELISAKEAEELSMHLLVRTQGIAIVSQAFSDKKVIHREVELINQWLDKLSQRKK